MPCREDDVAERHLAVQPACAQSQCRAATLAPGKARSSKGSKHLVMLWPPQLLSPS